MRFVVAGLVLSSLLLAACGGARPPEAAPPAPEAAAAPEAGLAPEEPSPVEEPTTSTPPPPPPPPGQGEGSSDPDATVGTGKNTRAAELPSRKQDAKPRPADLGLKDEARPLAAVAETSGERVSRDTLARVVDEHMESFRRCASVDAKVRVRLSLSGGGSVTKAEALRSQPDDARVRDCVAEVLRGLSFPRGAGSDTSTVEFDLVLSRPSF